MKTFTISFMNGTNKEVEGCDTKVSGAPDGFGFFAHNNNGVWRVYEVKSGFLVGTGATRKAATDLASKRLTHIGHEEFMKRYNTALVMKENTERNRKTVEELEEEFQFIFRTPILWFYTDGFHIGFDVVRFDEKLVKPEEGESTAEAVLRKYGPRALTIVKRLLNMPDEAEVSSGKE